MIITLEHEDLVRMFTEYVKHLGVDLSKSNIEIDFKAGRKFPSYAEITVLEKENSFIGTFPEKANINNEPIKKEVQLELPIESRDISVLKEVIVSKEEDNDSDLPIAKDLLEDTAKEEVKPAKADLFKKAVTPKPKDEPIEEPTTTDELVEEGSDEEIIGEPKNLFARSKTAPVNQSMARKLFS